MSSPFFLGSKDVMTLFSDSPVHASCRLVIHSVLRQGVHVTKEGPIWGLGWVEKKDKWKKMPMILIFILIKNS